MPLYLQVKEEEIEMVYFMISQDNPLKNLYMVKIIDLEELIKYQNFKNMMIKINILITHNSNNNKIFKMKQIYDINYKFIKNKI